MKTNAAIRFDAELLEVNGQTIVRLPEEESRKLPSRGQVAVVGTLNEHPFQTVLEPDGYRGHFIKLVRDSLHAAGPAGGLVTLELEVTREWPEPVIPEDFATAIAAAPQKVKVKWNDITPTARWEWVRWINETRSPSTRAIRIEKTISKLNGEHRRPCCFDLSACTDPELSKSGKLMVEPGSA